MSEKKDDGLKITGFDLDVRRALVTAEDLDPIKRQAEPVLKEIILGLARDELAFGYDVVVSKIEFTDFRSSDLQSLVEGSLNYTLEICDPLTNVVICEERNTAVFSGNFLEPDSMEVETGAPSLHGNRIEILGHHGEIEDIRNFFGRSVRVVRAVLEDDDYLVPDFTDGVQVYQYDDGFVEPVPDVFLSAVTQDLDIVDEQSTPTLDMVVDVEVGSVDSGEFPAGDFNSIFPEIED